MRLDKWVFRLPVLVSSELGKLVMMLGCGCENDELNQWVRQAIADPYSWRTVNGHSFVAGPYSPIWYLFNQPARLGYLGWMSYLFLLDLAFSLFVFRTRSWRYILPYLMGSIYFYNIDPADLFVFETSLLGMITPIFSVFAIVLKLPWLPPLTPGYVWPFILNDPYGIHEPGGLLRYAQLGLAWTGGIVLYIWRKRKRRLTVNAVTCR